MSRLRNRWSRWKMRSAASTAQFELTREMVYETRSRIFIWQWRTSLVANTDRSNRLKKRKLFDSPGRSVNLRHYGLDISITNGSLTIFPRRSIRISRSCVYIIFQLFNLLFLQSHLPSKDEIVFWPSSISTVVKRLRRWSSIMRKQCDPP